MAKADNNQFDTAVCIAVYEHTTLCNNWWFDFGLVYCGS